jgi:hypothetical protein
MVSSSRAPISTLLADNATENPNWSAPVGVGSLKVCSRFPVIASNRFAWPELPPLVSSPNAPISTLLPVSAAEDPNVSDFGGLPTAKSSPIQSEAKQISRLSSNLRTIRKRGHDGRCGLRAGTGFAHSGTHSAKIFRKWLQHFPVALSGLLDIFMFSYEII